MKNQVYLEIKMIREDAERHLVPEDSTSAGFNAGYTHGFVAGLKKVERMLGIIITE